MSRGLLAGLYLLTLALTPTAARAEPAAQPETSAVDDKEARDLFRIGKEAFEEGRYERALKYFKEAYELSRRPALLSNIGTTLDRLRRDREAVDVYKQYLTEVPEAANRALIESRIQLIEAALARTVAPAAEPSPPQAATAPPPAVATPRPDNQAPASAPLVAPAAQAPTPAQTARAAEPLQSDTTSAAPEQHTPSASAPLTSRWWFWTGIGAAAAVAVVAGLAASSNANGGTNPSPVVLDTQTRVREL